MADARDILGTVFKNGSATLLARVAGANAVNIVQADIASIKYTVYLLDEDDEDSQTAIVGHIDVALTVASIIYNTLQTDARWSKDATGYNFAHVLDVSTDEAFAVAGQSYRVIYELTPTSGQAILVRFVARVI